ncbi:MAG: peptide chain release factor N(5)-glutamine methyltransferase [Rickettsiales bacterium]|jgi:release factor glutamine methyltransferase|nr:peptide chain release factor N(5)-glutamine methyltransferase [Rickettsiales bacterium]
MGTKVVDELQRASGLIREQRCRGTPGIAQLEARILLAAILGIETNSLRLKMQDELGDRDLEKFASYLARRAKGEPVSKIVGHKAFWDQDFFVDSHVMDPRQDSEIMIEAILHDSQILSPETDGEQKILDLGVGSGCLLLTAIRIFENAWGLGLDLEPGAIAVAEKNADLLGMKNVEFILNDWTDDLEGEFSLVLSNPPYIKTGDIATLEDEVRLYDPRIALDGGEDGLDCFRHIARGVGKNLTKLGKMYIEVGQGQAREVAGLFKENGFKLLRIEKDLRGIERILVFTTV